VVAGRVPAGRSPEGAVFDFAGTDHHYITVAREIHSASPGAGQYYAIQRSLEAETAFLGPMRLALIEIGLLALVVSLSVGYLIARGITAPVRALVRGAEEMERGNYDYPLAPRAGDEIGYLTRRFGDMRQRQRTYVKSLEEVARLKGDFIDVASHELRTPLSVLRGFLELLAGERLGPVTAGQRDAITAMEGGVLALTRVAENASRLAQVESDRLVLVLGEHDVRQILDEAAERARATAAGRTVTITTRADESAGTVTVDGPRLVEAVYQLACNGVRFTPDGGSVEVDATREGEDLVIRVRDTGVGIPADRLEHLLDRSLMLRGARHHHSSTTLEFNSGGLGLGIPIARAVADAHGGALAAQPAEDRGTVFTLRIPGRPALVQEEAA
jgi:signal transduction histidine kinase